MGRELRIIDGRINFACKKERCEKCCCGQFSGTGGNISSVDGRPFNEIVLTEEDCDRIRSNGRSDLIEEGTFTANGKNYHKIALNQSGSCKAFINGRCSINGFKPTLCSAFPFYIDMFSGLCVILCEGFTDEPCTEMSKMGPSMESARKMYEFWVDFYKVDDSEHNEACK